MYPDYNIAGLFLTAGIVTLMAVFLLWRLVRERGKGHMLERSTYESGEPPAGEAWRRYNFRFFVLAIVFLVFEVDMVFFYPWAAAYKLLLFGEPTVVDFIPLGFTAFGEMLFFLFFLVMAWVYVWRTDALRWL